jgi:hypothetical protein
VTERMISRLAGAAISVVGLVFVAWPWYTALNAGYFSPKIALISPIFVFSGFAMVIEGPDLPVRKLTPLGWAFLIVGIMGGLVNAYLLGAFDPSF